MWISKKMKVHNIHTHVISNFVNKKMVFHRKKESYPQVIHKMWILLCKVVICKPKKKNMEKKILN